MTGYFPRFDPDFEAEHEEMAERSRMIRRAGLSPAEVDAAEARLYGGLPGNTPDPWDENGNPL